MSENVIVNDSVKLTVKFRDIDPSGNYVEINISSISLEIKKSDGTVIVNIVDQPVSPPASFYEYVFTPSLADTYTIKFTGKYIDGVTEKVIPVEQKLYVSSVTQDYEPTIILGSDETIVFASDISPLYVDPESLLVYFPEASVLEVAEVVHNYSLEIKAMYKLSDDEDGSNLSFNVLEYIKAATACELSRTFGDGLGDEASLTLGDLTIANRSAPRTTITRDNAISWCQIATALRKEMLAGRVSPMAMQPKGLPTNNVIRSSGKMVDENGVPTYLSDLPLYGPNRRYTPKSDPMPKRGLRSYD